MATCHCPTAADNPLHPSVTSISRVRMSSSSIHHEVDPTVGDVVVTLHEPVVSGIVAAHDVILHGITDQLVVALDQGGERLPDVVYRLCVTVIFSDHRARVVP